MTSNEREWLPLSPNHFIKFYDFYIPINRIDRVEVYDDDPEDFHVYIHYNDKGVLVIYGDKAKSFLAWMDMHSAWW